MIKVKRFKSSKMEIGQSNLTIRLDKECLLKALFFIYYYVHKRDLNDIIYIIDLFYKKDGEFL